MERKSALSLILSDRELLLFANWLDEQYKKRADREVPEDGNDPELDLDCAIESILEDLAVEGYEFS